MKQTTKKLAAPAIERPHKDLTEIQEEIASLASDILLNGGAREDVDLMLTALLRHRVRRTSGGRHFQAEDPAKADQGANWSAQHLAERFYQGLAKHWPEKRPASADTPQKPAPTTVADLMRTNVRAHLIENFEEFYQR
jgi:thymidylate synthase ThyX